MLGFCLVFAANRPALAALQTITVRLDYLPNTYHAWLFLAKARGYYIQQGLDVDIQNGEGSIATLQVVGAGNGTIGIASLEALVLAAAEGVPVVGIAGVLQKAPEAVLSLKSTNIKKPSDLEGKSWGTSAQTACSRLFVAFLEANHIDASKVRQISVGPSALPALLHGNVDTTCGWAITDYLKAAKQGPLAPPMVFADYGVNALGIGIFVTKQTAQTQPDMIRRFLRASIEGEEAAQKDPNAAVDALMAAHPELGRSMMLEEVQALTPYLHTPRSAGHEYLWVAPADWQDTVRIAQKYFDVPASFDGGQFYTNAFLPAESK